MKKALWTLLAVCLIAFGIGVMRSKWYIIAEEIAVLEPVPYMSCFQQYAPTIGWDWETLAAVAWNESHFNPKATSYVGACGVMQLMPTTAYRFGLNDTTIWNPEDNIRAGVDYIRCLQKKFYFITDSAEQTKFVLASYNAGPAHIMDARRLARKYGENPYRWSTIEHYLGLLSQESFYTDSVVLYGAFNSTETCHYVHSVLRTARKYKLISDE